MTRSPADLTIEETLKEVSYNMLTGEFRWRSARVTGCGGTRRVFAAGDIATRKAANGYLGFTLNSVPVLAHRLAWFICYGFWPDDTDHIDGNRSNNTIWNLRNVPRRLNMQNLREAHRDSQSGLLGAYFSPKRQRWYSSICKDGKTKFLGYTSSAEQAHENYLKAKRKLHECCEI